MPEPEGNSLANLIRARASPQELAALSLMSQQLTPTPTERVLHDPKPVDTRLADTLVGTSLAFKQTYPTQTEATEYKIERAIAFLASKGINFPLRADNPQATALNSLGCLTYSAGETLRLKDGSHKLSIMAKYFPKGLRDRFHDLLGINFASSNSNLVSEGTTGEVYARVIASLGFPTATFLEHKKAAGFKHAFPQYLVEILNKLEKGENTREETLLGRRYIGDALETFFHNRVNTSPNISNGLEARLHGQSDKGAVFEEAVFLLRALKVMHPNMDLGTLPYTEEGPHMAIKLHQGMFEGYVRISPANALKMEIKTPPTALIRVVPATTLYVSTMLSHKSQPIQPQP